MPGRPLQQHRGRRRLGDEGERAVGVHGDDDRDDEAGLRLRLGVERLAELHDVDAALPERGTDRRARVRRPGRNLQLDLRDDLLRHARLRLLHLHEVELDGRGAPEDADQHAQLALVGLHLLDHAVEVLERPVDHLHLLALLEEHLGLRLDRPLLHLVRDLAHLGLGDGRDGVGVGGAAEEARDLRRRLHDVPGLVVEPHVDEDVAGEELPRRRLLLALDQLDDLLRRDQDLAEEVGLAEPADALLERRLHLVLVARVRVHHVPLPIVSASPSAEHPLDDELKARRRRRRGRAPTTITPMITAMVAAGSPCAWASAPS